jgi:hypothetical protein
MSFENSFTGFTYKVNCSLVRNAFDKRKNLSSVLEMLEDIHTMLFNATRRADDLADKLAASEAELAAVKAELVSLKEASTATNP